MSIEKKCPHCKEWTTWGRKLNDRCTHCHELLDEQRLVEYKEFKEQEEKYKRSEWFNPKPDDGIAMLILRKVGLFFHLLFSAISWLLIWSFANAAG